jgi:hypothetical protein
MVAEAAALVFEACDFESCTAIVQQLFCEYPSVSIIRVALSTRDLKALGARVWRLLGWLRRCASKWAVSSEAESMG